VQSTKRRTIRGAPFGVFNRASAPDVTFRANRVDTRPGRSVCSIDPDRPTRTGTHSCSTSHEQRGPSGVGRVPGRRCDRPRGRTSSTSIDEPLGKWQGDCMSRCREPAAIVPAAMQITAAAYEWSSRRFASCAAPKLLVPREIQYGGQDGGRQPPAIGLLAPNLAAASVGPLRGSSTRLPVIRTLCSSWPTRSFLP
jgi:hypothetical protein